jgi:DNA repair photolyase
MSGDPTPHKGRGAVTNPPNRFEKLHYEIDDEAERDDGAPPTQYYKDPTRTIIAHNDSPDVGFETSINPYRGCEHGCVYCFARPFHEYLGFSSGLDFETKIMVKEDAPELLRRELALPSWNPPKVIAISGVTDAYQPIERKTQLTRRCLEVLAEYRNPATIITKNHLITRDIDILSDMAKWNGIAVCISVTSLDESVARVMEPRASMPRLRIDAIEKLTAAGIPVGVMVAPIVPAITDHEVPMILKTTAEAGARTAGFVMLRLPYQLKSIFEAWLDTHFPDRKDKVMNRIREMRGGELYDSRWKIRGRGEGLFADQIRTLFAVSAKKYGIDGDFPDLSIEHFRRPAGNQKLLF